jgi:hypothetical protein
MKTSDFNVHYIRRRYEFVTAVLKTIILLASMGSQTAEGPQAAWSAGSEFGMGPRTSVGGTYKIVPRATPVGARPAGERS